MEGEELTETVTVLVADDDPDLLVLMKRRLMKAGYEVITATDGEEALQQAEEHRPRVAVLDVMMPKLTGTEVTRRLRAHPALADVIVVLISAGFQDNATGSGLPTGYGADAYVKKPFGFQELPTLVGVLLAAASTLPA